MTKSEITKAYNRTKRGISRRIYNHMLERSIKRGHRPPDFTRDELESWLNSQTLFHELYSEWKNSEYIKYLKPSVDRRDDNIHYCFTNIKLGTWYDNNRNARDDVLSGSLKSNSIAIVQLTKQGEYVNTYHSIAEAARKVNGNKKAITECLSGRTKTSAGFKWLKETIYQASK